MQAPIITQIIADSNVSYKALLSLADSVSFWMLIGLLAVSATIYVLAYKWVSK